MTRKNHGRGKESKNIRKRRVGEGEGREWEKVVRIYLEFEQIGKCPNGVLEIVR
jgi:hypothetical protein